MHSKAIDLEIFNQARNLYVSGKIQNTLNLLDEIECDEIELLKEEIQFSTGNNRYLNTLIKVQPQRILGLIDCPYHKYLNLEYAEFEDVHPTIKSDIFFKNIRCVLQTRCSDGLLNEQVVAIFPENFRSISAKEEYPVFYFVNKFSARHMKYCRPFLTNTRHGKEFIHLTALPLSRINSLVANWVNLHEISHRQGIMPIPSYLHEKSNRFTAALEELRADLMVIRTCYDSSTNITTDEYLTASYVLLERLIGYPLFREKLNFDTISSVFFWKYLSDNNYLSIEKLDLNLIFEGVRKLLDLITRYESESIQLSSIDLRKKHLKGLIVSYLDNYDRIYEEYQFFWSKK